MTRLVKKDSSRTQKMCFGHMTTPVPLSWLALIGVESSEKDGPNFNLGKVKEKAVEDDLGLIGKAKARARKENTKVSTAKKTRTPASTVKVRKVKERKVRQATPTMEAFKAKEKVIVYKFKPRKQRLNLHVPVQIASGVKIPGGMPMFGGQTTQATMTVTNGHG